MEPDEQIRQGLYNMAAKYGPPPTLIGTIKSVDEATKTCVILETVGDDTIEIEGLLRPVESNNESITIIPAIGSYILAVRVEDSEAWQVVATEKASKFRVATDTSLLQISNGILLQKDGDTLKQILVLLVQAVQKIIVLEGTNPDRVKLQAALDKINNLLQ